MKIGKNKSLKVKIFKNIKIRNNKEEKNKI